jgi:hydroxymethylglutaryl-CoA synthase
VTGLLSYGSYVPYRRLQRAAIGAALGAGGGRGTRAVASFDEDTTSMGVEAGRLALRATSTRPQAVYFATTAPAYLDKTNATVIHAALGLDASAFAVDMVGAVRSGVGSLLAAAEATRQTLAVLADVRGGLPGSADERDGGDAAAAFLWGDGPVIAEVVAVAGATAEFLDRWRLPGDPSSRVWEERFGESAYLPLAHEALADALKQAGLAQTEVDHAVIAGTHARSVKRFAAESGLPAAAFGDDLLASVGNSGAAHVGLLLADVLDRAVPEQTIVVSVLADGATTIVLRTTPALASYSRTSSIAEQVAAGNDSLSYPTYLSWRGFLDREPPRRPDPDAPAAPPSQRNERWKYEFAGSQCTECETRHLPPSRVCLNCGETDRMVPVPLANTPATVTTFTIDGLAYSPSPPLIAAVLDFDGGGRFRCQLTDIEPDSVAVGDRVEMTFRRMSTPRGIHNYFWKARPVRRSTTELSEQRDR